MADGRGSDDHDPSIHRPTTTTWQMEEDKDTSVLESRYWVGHFQPSSCFHYSTCARLKMTICQLLLILNRIKVNLNADILLIPSEIHHSLVRTSQLPLRQRISSMVSNPRYSGNLSPDISPVHLSSTAHNTRSLPFQTSGGTFCTPPPGPCKLSLKVRCPSNLPLHGHCGAACPFQGTGILFWTPDPVSGNSTLRTRRTVSSVYDKLPKLTHGPRFKQHLEMFIFLGPL